MQRLRVKGESAPNPDVEEEISASHSDNVRTKHTERN